MKKLGILLILITSLFILVGCGPKTYDEISYDELVKMLEEKQDFVLLIGDKECSACKSFKITIDKVIQDYKLDIKYIDLNKLNEEENAEVLSKFYLTGTPQTVFVTDGKEKDRNNRINGNQKYSKCVKILKENGYIKENE